MVRRLKQAPNGVAVVKNNAGGVRPEDNTVLNVVEGLLAVAQDNIHAAHRRVCVLEVLCQRAGSGAREALEARERLDMAAQDVATALARIEVDGADAEPARPASPLHPDDVADVCAAVVGVAIDAFQRGSAPWSEGIMHQLRSDLIMREAGIMQVITNALKGEAGRC